MSKITLSKDAEIALLADMAKSNKSERYLREFESEQHQKRQEQLAASRGNLNQAYRLHVLVTTLLNLISTGAVVALCLVIIKHVA